MALRILIADDHLDHVVVLAEFLTARGHRVETVSDGAAALDSARRRREGRSPYHLIILDLMMPGFDGLQVARELHMLRDPACLAMVTAYGATRSTLVNEARSLQALDVLDKPLDMVRVERLITMVEDKVRSAPGTGPGNEPPFGPGTVRTTRHSSSTGEDSRTSRYSAGNAVPVTEALERRPGTGSPPTAPVAPIARGTDQFRQPSGLFSMGTTSRYGRPGTPVPQQPTSTTRIRRGVTGIDRVASGTPSASSPPQPLAIPDQSPGRAVLCNQCQREFIALNRSVSYTTICIHCGQLNRIDPA